MLKEIVHILKELRVNNLLVFHDVSYKKAKEKCDIKLKIESVTVTSVFKNI